MLENLEKLFQDYIAYAGKLREETASFKAVLGFRDREIYDAGHKEFDKAVENWVQEFVQSGPTQQELVRGLEIILFTAAGYEEKSPFWYLCAVQRHGAALIPLLEKEGREKVLAEFEEKYPAGRRLPIQKDVYKLLKKDSGKKRFLPFL